MALTVLKDYMAYGIVRGSDGALLAVGHDGGYMFTDDPALALITCNPYELCEPLVAANHITHPEGHCLIVEIEMEVAPASNDLLDKVNDIIRERALTKLTDMEQRLLRRLNL